MTRRSLSLALALTLVACGDRDAPRRVNSLGSPPPGAAPPPVAASADPNDPAEPGISDLARLARYVFRTMQGHEEVCPLENPFRDTLHFAFLIEVTGGRMSGIGLGQVTLEAASGQRALSEAKWPEGLKAYVACMRPHLQAVVMAPAPADGMYQPVYSFTGRPDGRPAP